MRELTELNDEDEEVWVTHYSSNHQILLVGEGDFSFSCSLATSFTSASNIFASSLDSYDDVVRKYKKATSNLETLRRLGAFLLHGVDATKLQLYPDLNSRRFDRVIFNFPHAGFHGKESDPYLIQKHRKLVFGFFRVASRMLRADGEVHVSHKNKAPFCHWKLEDLASRCGLVLKQCVAFEKGKYPGYENKRGDGSKCDEPFILGDCSTFRFRVAKELHRENVKQRAAKKKRDSKHQKQFTECTNRIDRVSFEIRNGELRRMLPEARTSFRHPYTKETPVRRCLLCQDLAIQPSRESFPELGGFRGIYEVKGLKMLIRNSFPHSERHLSRQ